MDNGQDLFLYLGAKTSDKVLYDLFGYATQEEMKAEGIETFYPVEGSEPSELLSQMIEQIKAEKSAGPYPQLKIIYGADKRERELMNLCLCEDSVDKAKDFPYSDFIVMLHKSIQNRISS